jgi:hypothetical protein
LDLNWLQNANPAVVYGVVYAFAFVETCHGAFLHKKNPRAMVFEGTFVSLFLWQNVKNSFL